MKPDTLASRVVEPALSGCQWITSDQEWVHTGQKCCAERTALDENSEQLPWCHAHARRAEALRSPRKFRCLADLKWTEP